MSAPVDVLAAYDRRAAALRRSVRIAISREWAPEEIERRQKELASLNNEAEAILNLIEAGKVASALLKGVPRSLGYDFDASQLDAALARVQP